MSVYWGIGRNGAHGDSRAVDFVAAFEDDGFVPMGLLRMYGFSIEAAMLCYTPEDSALMFDGVGNATSLFRTPDETAFVDVDWFVGGPWARFSTVFEDGSLVQTQLRWRQLPPWPTQLRRVRRHMTLERDMLRDDTGRRGRSCAITTALQPVAMLVDHQEHVRRYAEVRGSQPLRHASAQHAADVLNAAMEHSGSSLARVGWASLLAAIAVVLAVCAIAVTGWENPLLVISAAIVGGLVVWFGSPLMKAWLWGASFIRPSFSLAH
jgi:hypothetical protein